MSVTFKVLTLVVTVLTAISSFAAERKQENVKAKQVAKAQTVTQKKKADVHTTDMTELTVEESKEAPETMEFYSQLPTDQEREKQ